MEGTTFAALQLNDSPYLAECQKVAVSTLIYMIVREMRGVCDELIRIVVELWVLFKPCFLLNNIPFSPSSSSSSSAPCDSLLPDPLSSIHLLLILCPLLMARNKHPSTHVTQQGESNHENNCYINSGS